MLEARSVGNILHNNCLGVCVLLIINLCDANMYFGLTSGTKSVKGSRIDIMCDLGAAYQRVDLYKTDTSSTKGAYIFNACRATSCLPFPGYIFTQTATTVTVTILDLQRHSDEKWWTCRDQTGAKAQFKLTVYTEPKGVVFSSTKPCDLAKETCHFTCQTSSCTSPEPSFLFYYSDTTGGVTEPMFGNFVQGTGGSVDTCSDEEFKYTRSIVIPMNTTFPGNLAKTITLECRIRFVTLANELKSQPSDPVHFAVAVEQVHILPEPGDFLNIVEDNSEPVICITSGCRPASTVVWFIEKTGQGTRQLGAGTEVLIPVENDLTVTNSTLMFRTTRADKGWRLSCQAVSFGANRVSASNPKELNILYPPDAAITFLDKEPRDIILKCSADGEPPNYNFDQWVHMAPDRTTEIQRYSGHVSGGENTLVLKNVTYRDSGTYTCKVSNNISTSAAQFGIDNKEIHVADKPYVIKDGRELYAEQHGNLSISVRFYSYQLIKKITWIKIIKEKKTPLVSGDKYDTSITSETIRVPFYTKNINLQGKRSQLHIKDVDVVDYAEYEVHIENSFSEEIVRLVLKPEGLPEVPKNFTILQESVTTSSIGFSWFPGYHGGADQTFYIEYKLEGQGWREGVSFFGGKLNQQFQSKVDGLASGSSYSFRIYSRNVHGNSTDKSQRLVGNTKKEAVVSEPPSLIGPAVGGGLGAAVLIVLVIVGVVFVIRRWPNKSQGPTEGIVVEGDRTGISTYEELGVRRETTQPYELLQPAASTSDMNIAGFSQYEELGVRREISEPYEKLQPAASQMDVNTIEKKMYENASITKRSGDNKGNSRDAPCTGNAQSVMYSNLKLATEL